VAAGGAVGRLGATLVAMVQTRLALAAVELEEESQRLLGYLILALLALFLFGIAVVLAAIVVIALFWDSYRILAVLGMAGLFAAAAFAIGMKLRASLRSRPRLLSASVAELDKDIDFVRNAGHAHEN
jgi:uncharacterized membrane protein YqjE